DEWYKGEPWLPTGLVNAADLKEEWLNPPVEDIVEYPWALLQDHTRGIRKSEGEIVILHAPTGVGKTTVVDEIVYHIHQTHPNEKLGLLKLEESNRASLNGLLSIHTNKRLRFSEVFDAQSSDNKNRWFDEVFGDRRIILYDHFGSTSIDEII